MEKLAVNYDGSFCYDICFTEGFHQLSESLKNVDASWNKVCVITDSNVGPLYLDKVIEELSNSGLFSKITSFTFPAGEENKTLDVIQDMYAHLIEEHLDRKDVLVALGGGVVGDMTGYCAATYLRGIDFIQIPTTLLSQVDSSVGGKTGVDFRGYKNMVGAFYMPRLVYMNRETLKTLPMEQLRSGLGEVIKSALIRNSDLFDWLNLHVEEILHMDSISLEHAVIECCKIKRAVVEEDPKEAGIRAILNFGHTIGHAVEKLTDFQITHGECVGIGSCAASYLCMQRGLLSDEEFQTILMSHQRFGMYTRIPQELSAKLTPEEILATTKSDKKMVAGQIKFVLLNGTGNAIVLKDVTDEEIIDAIRSVM